MAEKWNAGHIVCKPAVFEHNKKIVDCIHFILWLLIVVARAIFILFKIVPTFYLSVVMHFCSH